MTDERKRAKTGMPVVDASWGSQVMPPEFHVMYTDKDGNFQQLMSSSTFAEIEAWLTEIGAQYWEIG